MTIRMAQYGVGHGHAAGKLRSMRQNPDVELVGVYEPNSERRQAAQDSADAFNDVYWFEAEAEILDDPTIIAVASEGRNVESLAQTEQVVRAAKHVWYDKPAGDDWQQWQQVVALAEEKKITLQMGYMFRYHNGFRQIGQWAKSGLLGNIFSVRAHMSTSIPEASRQIINDHPGGILYDLGGHVLDQIVWLLGRPDTVTSFLRHDDALVPGFKDNTLAVFEYKRALAWVDIAAMETPPTARRFEVYGSRGSALMQPFEPAQTIRLCLLEAHGDYQAGEQIVSVQSQSRQSLYDLELEAFLATISGRQPPDRSPAHELLVQETLLRATKQL